MAKRTPLYARHAALGARLVDFGGWDMPLHYGSQLDEHHRVRRAAGLFDVSHMTIVDFADPAPTRTLLRHLLANDVARLYPGKALYTCMLNEAGGVIDDLIVYDRGAAGYRLVLNAATRDKDLAWIAPIAARFGAAWRERDDLAMLAAQGPEALARLELVLGAATVAAVRALKPFHALEAEGLFIARTGYTGEDGVEILPPAAVTPELWDRILAADVAPCGLGARDTLRLEAGMNLYGSDMDETTTPLVSGLGWTVAWEPMDRDFLGRAALERQRTVGVPQTFVGLVLEERGVLRGHQPVYIDDREIGQITSGTFSPTLTRAIALARVEAGVGVRCQVDIRGKRLPARVVKPPFVRHGRVLIE
ncbi:MAG: glycine cleavage system aminomethyltransferase GcvT [Candidatus Contendobacter sp.]|nr:glycine cleavage system aminomethyltransferase GcvT [Candidatus Contendobacter sp.]MDG4558585.1 glycine cleavage system aminomethyltransferase GcvT [Candidatus Contendobacter sp.]